MKATIFIVGGLSAGWHLGAWLDGVEGAFAGALIAYVALLLSIPFVWRYLTS